MSVDFKVDVGQNTMNFNTGYLAKQADGAVLVSLGETLVLATAVASRDVREGQDFFPLSVEYREKFYAAGKIPGGFIKRESRPSDREVLTCRITDRPLRPLFPKDFLNEVQIIIYVLSSDKENQQDVLAINAASAALSISGMPFKGPVGAVRVGRINGEWIVNPTFSQSKESDIDIVVAGTKKAVTMIEGFAKNVSEEEMLEAVNIAHENIKTICLTQEELIKAVGKEPIEYTPITIDETIFNVVRERYYSDIENLKIYTMKHEREDAYKAIIKRACEEMDEEYPDSKGEISNAVHDLDSEAVRKRILEENGRTDGRGLKDVRPIDIMIGLLPRTHGSAVFTRGETQSLGVTTLGSVGDAQRLDQLEGDGEKRFMLHYNFPPFSVGETGRTGGVGRREIGHGMLAERALDYVIPDIEDFPYTIRQVSETLESNGSSSMATVCSGSLSMFNAGVPLKGSVAGIAMGLVMEGDKYAVLSDIQGLEDHLGDMDFKVAGTREGITAFQLDIKIEGITSEIMEVALAQAKEGRLHILDTMDAIQSTPETEVSEHAPKVKIFKIAEDKIGGVIGPGGKVIKKITEDSGAVVNIENDGTVSLSSESMASIDMAEKAILGIVEEVEVGKIYEGVVKRVVDFGAFVEILPGKDGLVHISNMAQGHVKQVSDVVKLGDTVKVKVVKIDRQGRVDLSMRMFENNILTHGRKTYTKKWINCST